MKKKQILFGTGYIILIVLFLIIAGTLLSKFSNLSDNVLKWYALGLIVSYVLFGVLLGIPFLIKSLSTPGKIKLNVVSLILLIISSIMSLKNPLVTVFIPIIKLKNNEIGNGFLILILFGYSLITIVKKEPVAQISE